MKGFTHDQQPEMGPTQRLLFPIADELTEAGHFALAIKTIVYATRTDIVMTLQARAIAKYDRKLAKLSEQSVVLEAEYCKAMKHDHSHI